MPGRRETHRIFKRRALLSSGAVVLWAAGAAADTSESPAARADRLFQEGKQLLQAGKPAEACPRLAESQRLDPGTGTLLALALCHESEGMTASAWREFQDVLVAAGQAGREDRLELARTHAAALEAALSRLVVDVTATQGRDEIVVRLDGQILPATEWGKPLPADPGEHVVQASARAKAPWSTKIVLAKGPRTETLSVPPLEAATSERPADAGRAIGFVVGGAGIAALGVGAFFGVRAITLAGDVRSRCPSSPCTDAGAVGVNDEARTSAWISDVALGFGVLGVALGTYLVVRPRPNVVARVAPFAGTTGGGAMLSGTF